jgi:hypothetical protein
VRRYPFRYSTRPACNFPAGGTSHLSLQVKTRRTPSSIFPRRKL